MATTTITTTAPEDARIAAAFGAELGLGRNATAPEIKAAIIAYVTFIVRKQEFAAAEAAISVTNISPT